MAAAAHFDIGDTHGLFASSGNPVQISSAALGWTSLFLSEQEEQPFEASAEPVPDHLLVFHLGGPAQITGVIEDKKITTVIPPGGLCLWPANSPFSIELENSVETLHLYIRSSIVNEVAASLGYDYPDGIRLRPRVGQRDELLEQLALEVRSVAASGGSSTALYVDQMALAIAARLIRHDYSAQPAPAAANNRGLARGRLKRVEDFVEAHLERPIQLHELSLVGGLSVSHFVRQFKLATGVSPHQFVLRRRVERAKRLLSHSDQSLAQIAYSCGFSHQEHLTHTFRRHVGATPGNYRRSAQG
ncbi:helix-turn-helix domain-containing protein [Sphingobium chlorophenolicum]|uniref:Transcriptional regulator, AraC family n=1 Tax=Sphingobium chlorophenolicum TaxID=46429 RepID=A0A081RF89_SPHCR|nr:AraC family transcriptional regulator [Sphingobium chlorophenolicum]KEQ53862.1 Transcriptional regulator, AraC family [Sphingobium chlorophenolicum]